MRFHIAAIGGDVPLLSFALERQVQLAWEGQIRSVSGAALALTVATLAVVLEQRLTGDLITDGAAGAAAGIKARSILFSKFVRDGTDVWHHLLPAVTHALQRGIIFRCDEAGVDQLQARAGFNFGKGPGDHSVQR